MYSLFGSSSASQQPKPTTRRIDKPRRWCVRSDNRVVAVYKKPNGPGYVQHRRTADGTRNVPFNGTTYKTEQLAKERATRNKERAKKKKASK